MSWGEYFETWGWAIAKKRRIGTVSLLCLLCGPMVWGIFIYHIYLVWAGMTTNENNKWSRWRDHIADSHVYKRTWYQPSRDVSNGEGQASMEAKQANCSAPKEEVEQSEMPGQFERKRLLVRTEYGCPPNSGGKGYVWHRISHISEVDNIYDLGFRNNLRDIFFARKI